MAEEYKHNYKESSLTAPSDRDLNNKWKPEQGVPSLNNDETEEAMKTLNITSFTDKFPCVDRTYADPPVSLQTYGLLSFIPAKGATPNKNGVYGFSKLRGNYASQEEANQRAEFLIRNVDSYHKIFHAYVGRPFPLTVSSKFSEETTEIDIRKQTTESISENVRQKKMDEAKIVQDIKDREQELIADTKKEEEEPQELYTTLRVKKAQLSWTYLEHIKKIKEIRGIVLKTREKILEMENENSEYREKYFDKYMNARKESGFRDTEEDMKNTFIKFLVEDEPLPGIDLELVI